MISSGQIVLDHQTVKYSTSSIALPGFRIWNLKLTANVFVGIKISADEEIYSIANSDWMSWTE